MSAGTGFQADTVPQNAASTSSRGTDKKTTTDTSSSENSSGLDIASRRVWSQELLNELVEVSLRTLNYSTRRDLERRVR